MEENIIEEIHSYRGLLFIELTWYGLETYYGDSFQDVMVPHSISRILLPTMKFTILV